MAVTDPPSNGNGYTAHDLRIAEQIARVETVQAQVLAAVNDHLHEHRWWARMMVGIFITSVAGLITGLLR